MHAIYRLDYLVTENNEINSKAYISGESSCQASFHLYYFLGFWIVKNDVCSIWRKVMNVVTNLCAITFAVLLMQRLSSHQNLASNTPYRDFIRIAVVTIRRNKKLRIHQTLQALLFFML